MKLRIESDGTGRGTQVFTEAGERIDGVVAVQWSCRVNERALVTIELAGGTRLHAQGTLSAPFDQGSE